MTIAPNMPLHGRHPRRGNLGLAQELMLKLAGCPSQELWNLTEEGSGLAIFGRVPSKKVTTRMLNPMLSRSSQANLCLATSARRRNKQSNPRSISKTNSISLQPDVQWERSHIPTFSRFASVICGPTMVTMISH